MTDSPKPYMVWYRGADDKGDCVRVNAYNASDALYSAAVKLIAAGIAPKQFSSIEPDGEQWAWMQEQRQAIARADLTNTIRDMLK